MENITIYIIYSSQQAKDFMSGENFIANKSYI